MLQKHEPVPCLANLSLLWTTPSFGMSRQPPCLFHHISSISIQQTNMGEPLGNLWMQTSLGKASTPDLPICASLSGHEAHLRELLYKDKCAACNKIAPPNERFKVCKRCRCTYYCSRACQKKHWAEHREDTCWGMREILRVFGSLRGMYSFRATQRESVDLARVWRMLNMLTLEGCQSASAEVGYAECGADYLVAHPQSVYLKFMHKQRKQSHILLYFRSAEKPALYFSLLDQRRLVEHCTCMRDEMLKMTVEARGDDAELAKAKANARYWVDLVKALCSLLSRRDGRRPLVFGFALESMALFFWPVFEEHEGKLKQVVVPW